MSRTSALPQWISKVLVNPTTPHQVELLFTICFNNNMMAFALDIAIIKNFLDLEKKFPFILSGGYDHIN